MIKRCYGCNMLFDTEKNETQIAHKKKKFKGGTIWICEYCTTKGFNAGLHLDQKTTSLSTEKRD